MATDRIPDVPSDLDEYTWYAAHGGTWPIRVPGSGRFIALSFAVGLSDGDLGIGWDPAHREAAYTWKPRQPAP